VLVDLDEATLVGLHSGYVKAKTFGVWATTSGNEQLVDLQLVEMEAGAEAGFVRLIARPSLVSRHKAGGKVIGATIVGARAGEMINEVALVMSMNAYGARLAQTVRAYPSWSTVMRKAASRWFYDYDGAGARKPRR